MHDAGVVDDNVDPFERLQGRGDDRDGAGLGADV
jgi:hypothetical protein